MYYSFTGGKHNGNWLVLVSEDYEYHGYSNKQL